jgi:zinc finger protein 830
MDAKSLLRAKKAEAKIQHPYASYNAAGQLRCSICAIPGVFTCTGFAMGPQADGLQ